MRIVCLRSVREGLHASNFGTGLPVSGANHAIIFCKLDQKDIIALGEFAL